MERKGTGRNDIIRLCITIDADDIFFILKDLFNSEMDTRRYVFKHMISHSSSECDFIPKQESVFDRCIYPHRKPLT